MPRTLSLNDHLNAFVDAQVDSGRFSTDREVVEAALRLLEARELRLTEIRQSIEVSRRDGQLLSEAETFDSLEARYAAPSDQAKQG